MAALGAVGVNLARTRVVLIPSAADSRGTLQISGTAQIAGVAANTRVDLYDARMTRRLYAVESAVDGAFLLPNLAAGRYVVVVDGRGAHRARTFYVDVS